MTISEAFRNRGLLVPEMSRPYYRITYGITRYDRHTVIFRTESWKTAKEELTELWHKYAEQNRIREDSVIEIHCVPEPKQAGAKERQPTWI